MIITRKDRIKKPSINPTGEQIYEMIGRPKYLGGATKHSFGHVVIPPKCSSRLHYHPEAEETYYILKGKGKMLIDGKEHFVHSGDAIFIRPSEKHQIFTEGNKDLEFIVICAPSWEPTNSVFVDGK
ncbi:MAG: cupin domain-containing protein [Patescibacteria group bacterium]